MCPDGQLISAYFDDELDKQWSMGLKDHLSRCAECNEKLSDYQKLNVLMDQTVVPGELEIKVRMLGEIGRRAQVIYPEAFWRKHLLVSLPVLMGAAALVIIFFVGMMMGLIPFQGQEQQLVEEIRTDSVPINVQVINLEDVAAYILSDDSGFDLLITIPSSETLSVSGEPRLIREADYKRGQ